MPPRVDTRQRLIESAVELIHERSYASVGVTAICQHAGVQKGSFYHFFPSKHDLALAAIEAMIDHYDRVVFKPSLSIDGPALDRIERVFARAWSDQLATTNEANRLPGCQLGNLAAELGAQDESIRMRLQAAFDHFEEQLEQSLDQGGPSPEPRAEASLVSQAVFAYLQGVLLLAKTANDPDLILRLAPFVRDLVSPTVLTPAAP